MIHQLRCMSRENNPRLPRAELMFPPVFSGYWVDYRRQKHPALTALEADIKVTRGLYMLAMPGQSSNFVARTPGRRQPCWLTGKAIDCVERYSRVFSNCIQVTHTQLKLR